MWRLPIDAKEGAIGKERNSALLNAGCDAAELRLNVGVCGSFDIRQDGEDHFHNASLPIKNPRGIRADRCDVPYEQRSVFMNKGRSPRGRCALYASGPDRRAFPPCRRDIASIPVV